MKNLIENLIAMFQVYVLNSVKDRFWRSLRGCGFRHNYEMYAPHAYMGKAAIVEYKCSRCGDWYNEIHGWQIKPDTI